MFAFPPHSRTSPLYIFGIFPVFAISFLGTGFYLRQFRGEFFYGKSKDYLLELLRMIAQNEDDIHNNEKRKGREGGEGGETRGEDA